MGFTAMLAGAVLVLLILTIRAVVIGIRDRDWKTAAISVAGFLGVCAGLLWALVSFITSM